MEDIINKVDKLFLRNKKLEKDKFNLYSEYLLNLNKEFLFDTKFSSNKKEDNNQQEILESEAFNLCEEILKTVDELDLMILYKAKVYSEIFLCYDDVKLIFNENLTQRCKKYLEYFDEFSSKYNYILNYKFSDKKGLFDLSGTRIQKI